jgi:hypothetical protein
MHEADERLAIPSLVLAAVRLRDLVSLPGPRDRVHLSGHAAVQCPISASVP